MSLLAVKNLQLICGVVLTTEVNEHYAIDARVNHVICADEEYVSLISIDFPYPEMPTFIGQVFYVNTTEQG